MTGFKSLNHMFLKSLCNKDTYYIPMKPKTNGQIS